MLIKMFRVAIASIVFASVSAARIQDHEFASVVKSKSKFGASCGELREMFHDRVERLQSFIDERQEGTDLSTFSQARLLMRAYSVVRTLRRARECSWVIDGDNDEIDQVQHLVQTFLADNPCAPAARAELDAGTSTATEEIAMRSVLRAMSILNSEDCQVSDADEEAMNGPPMEEEEMRVQVDELDAQVLDHVEDLVEEGDSGGAFVQMDSGNFLQTRRGFLRALGVAFMFILLALACIGVAAAIGFILGFAISYPIFIDRQQGGFSIVAFGIWGSMATGGVGVAACSYQLVTDFLPRVSN